MSKEKTTPKNTLTPDIQEVKENLQVSLKHHKKFRDYAQECYSYHHQMIIHLQEQLDQIEGSDKNER